MADENSNDNVSTEPVVKMATMKNPNTGQPVEVTKEVKEMINAMVDIGRKDATSKVEGRFKPIEDALKTQKTENTDLANLFQEFKDSQLPEAEQKQAQFKRTVDEMESKLNTAVENAGMWKSKFHDNQIKNDIYSAFGDHKLANPEQTAILFSHAGKTRIEEAIDAQGNGTGIFETRMSMVVSDGNGGYKEVDGTPKELFTAWIALDSNKHLLMNSLSAGGGSGHTGNLNNGSELEKAIAQYEQAEKEGNVNSMMVLKDKIRELRVS